MIQPESFPETTDCTAPPEHKRAEVIRDDLLNDLSTTYRAACKISAFRQTSRKMKLRNRYALSLFRLFSGKLVSTG